MYNCAEWKCYSPQNLCTDPEASFALQACCECGGGTLNYDVCDPNPCASGQTCTATGGTKYTCVDAGSENLSCSTPLVDNECYVSDSGRCAKGECFYTKKPIGSACGNNYYCNVNGICEPQVVVELGIGGVNYDVIWATSKGLDSNCEAYLLDGTWTNPTRYKIVPPQVACGAEDARVAIPTSVSDEFPFVAVIFALPSGLFTFPRTIRLEKFEF